MSEPEVARDGDEVALLTEALTLLIQRQCELEEWLREETSRATARAAAAERLQGDIDNRLEALEAHLLKVLPVLEQPRTESRNTERLERLRQHLDWLQTPGHSDVEGAVDKPPEPSHTAEHVASVPPPTLGETHVTSRQSVADRIGSTVQERFGAAFIAFGVLGLMYALALGIRPG